MNKNQEQLNLLKTFYYVYGGISAVFYSLIFILLIIIFVIMMNGGKGVNPEIDTTEILVNLSVMGAICLIYGVGTSIATILVGKFINQRRNHLYCLILAGVNCISFPIGTALGVFTFVVLLRDSVKHLFGKE